MATNTLVERKGATVGLITTDGFRDLLEMREGLKEDRYNLRMNMVEPLAARYLRAGVPERVRASGAVERPLDETALIESLEHLVSEGAEALAVCFLFSYLNPAHERRASEIIIRQPFPGTVHLPFSRSDSTDQGVRPPEHHGDQLLRRARFSAVTFRGWPSGSRRIRSWRTC